MKQRDFQTGGEQKDVRAGRDALRKARTVLEHWSDKTMRR